MDKLLIIIGFFLIAMGVFIRYADYLKIGPGVAIEIKRIKNSIDNLNKQIKDIYDNFITEKVGKEDLDVRFKIFKDKDRNIFVFKLRYSPLINSIDLLWGIAYQPPDTYIVINNLLIFGSKEDMTSMERGLYSRFIIRYLKNIKQGKQLELNDIEIQDGKYYIKSSNRTFKPEDFVKQSIIFE